MIFIRAGYSIGHVNNGIMHACKAYYYYYIYIYMGLDVGDASYSLAALQIALVDCIFVTDSRIAVAIYIDERIYTARGQGAPIMEGHGFFVHSPTTHSPFCNLRLSHCMPLAFLLSPRQHSRPYCMPSQTVPTRTSCGFAARPPSCLPRPSHTRTSRGVARSLYPHSVKMTFNKYANLC